MSLMNRFRDALWPERDGRQGTRTAGKFRMPETDDGWLALRDWYWAAYYHEGYSEDDIASLQLFLAYDEATPPNTIGETVRVVEDFAHVVDVGTSVTLGGLHSLDDAEGIENDAGRSQDLELAQAVWRRSRYQERKYDVVRSAMMMGEAFLETARLAESRPYRTVLVPHDPRCVVVQYDSLGMEIEHAEITIHESHRGGGIVDSRRRILTPTEVVEEVNGREVSRNRHLLGVVPLAHFRAIPVAGDGESHAVSVAHSIRVAVAQVDSALSQARCITSRHGNPLLVSTGAMIANGADVMQMGRVLVMPPNTTVQYLTPDASAIQSALKLAAETRATYMGTMPEFLFTSMSGGESGEARRYRAEALQAKYGEIRTRIFGAFEHATHLAVDMERGRAHDPDRLPFRIGAPPILSLDEDKIIERLVLLRDKHLLRKPDAIRELQGLGYVPADADPEEYAALLEDDSATAASAYFDGGAGGPAAAPPAPAAAPGAAPEDDDDMDDGEDTTAQPVAAEEPAVPEEPIGRKVVLSLDVVDDPQLADLRAQASRLIGQELMQDYAPHVTLLYLGRIRDEDIQRVRAIATMAIGATPFPIVAPEQVSTFPVTASSEGRTPVIVRVRSLDLEALHARLREVLADVLPEGLHDYVPHLTLGFAEGDLTLPQRQALASLSAVRLAVSTGTVSLSIGDERFSLPFRGRP